MSDLLRRQNATQATMNKYRHREWAWETATTCLHMARFHLRKMGHKPQPIPRIRSAVGAKRALKKNGWNDVVDMLDSMFPRIPHSQMLLGDLAVLESEDGFGAIVVCAGFKVFGWHDDAKGMVNMTPNQIKAAYRV